MTVIFNIGVDVSKDHLDVFMLPTGEATRLTNTATGFVDLFNWLGNRAIARIVFEATGAYHKSFEQALSARGMPYTKVNPYRARRFAQAIGKLAKTDRVDAALLARMGIALESKPSKPFDQRLDEMKELLVARRSLSKDRTATLTRRKTLKSNLLLAQNAARLRQINLQLASIDKALLGLASQNESFAAKLRLLKTIPGISDKSALTLLIEMPELGEIESKQAASLAGLAPMARQSGIWTGASKITGGRRALRHALYMPALVACRHNPDLKAKYEALRAAGKPAKVALTAIMRKLLIVANACIARNGAWHHKTT
ncbi:transposase [Asticcacaulis sp. BYS171W]|uniref:Transposase n=1 Tax=Asticcacaulis aquaticus TaxID=2984212 RepID=A0ABT5HYA4_9CAUL|nr:transposase [Asticcacaulis aquaticus]MDC7684426.1 transposase [Asticcacaulis aquaticus]